jgi:hypothetical protein
MQKGFSPSNQGPRTDKKKDVRKSRDTVPLSVCIRIAQVSNAGILHSVQLWHKSILKTSSTAAKNRNLGPKT